MKKKNSEVDWYLLLQKIRGVPGGKRSGKFEVTNSDSRKAAR